jgi:hypothetical protein
MPKPDPLPWLLEEDNPSVRYFTLRDLLGKPERSAEVQSAKAAIRTGGIVPKILARQNPDGSWAEPLKFYRNKYKGTGWQLIILAHLGADGSDPGIAKAVEFFLRHAQERESGGFSVDFSITADGAAEAGSSRAFRAIWPGA